MLLVHLTILPSGYQFHSIHKNNHLNLWQIVYFGHQRRSSYEYWSVIDIKCSSCWLSLTTVRCTSLAKPFHENENHLWVEKEETGRNDWQVVNTFISFIHGFVSVGLKHHFLFINFFKYPEKGWQRRRDRLEGERVNEQVEEGNQKHRQQPSIWCLSSSLTHVFWVDGVLIWSSLSLYLLHYLFPNISY